MMVGKMNIEWTPMENLALPPSLATTTTEHLKDWAASIHHPLLHLCYSPSQLQDIPKKSQVYAKDKEELKTPSE